VSLPLYRISLHVTALLNDDVILCFKLIPVILKINTYPKHIFNLLAYLDWCEGFAEIDVLSLWLCIIRRLPVCTYTSHREGKSMRVSLF